MSDIQPVHPLSEDEPPQEHESGSFTPGTDESEPLPPGRVARRAFGVITPLAVLAVVIAVALNWWFVPGLGEALPSPQLPGDTLVQGVPGPDEPGSSALALIPDRIIQYEPITVQAVPGYENRAAEAVFKTLQMNLEAQIPTLVYVRAEVLGSSAEASARLDQLMAPYTLSAANVMVGQTVARQGWTADQGNFARGWVSGSNMTLVKASFSDWVPEHTFEIIEMQGIKVSEAVEVYQRTGLKGVSAQ